MTASGSISGTGIGEPAGRLVTLGGSELPDDQLFRVAEELRPAAPAEIDALPEPADG